MGLLEQLYAYGTHRIGSATGKYYFEDYIRVYPDATVYNRFGWKREASENDRRNFLNHQKFYKFGAQFVRHRKVGDIGCGAGHGCPILRESGAATVWGCDISKKAIEFARSRYAGSAEFSAQNATDLDYPDDLFDVCVSSEVLEHLKEYGKESEALQEMRRVTRENGLLLIGTPNSELLQHHGFSFQEINKLCEDHLAEFCIFENALIPFGPARREWERRLAKGATGLIISENINLDETVLLEEANPEVKKGLPAGRLTRLGHEIDTTVLHNTHSWIILGINSKS